MQSTTPTFEELLRLLHEQLQQACQDIARAICTIDATDTLRRFNDAVRAAQIAQQDQLRRSDRNSADE